MTQQATDFVDLDGIASRLGAARSYVRDRVVKRPDFPRPAIVLSQKVVRWNAADFERWVEKKKKEWAR